MLRNEIGPEGCNRGFVFVSTRYAQDLLSIWSVSGQFWRGFPFGQDPVENLPALQSTSRSMLLLMSVATKVSAVWYVSHIHFSSRPIYFEVKSCYKTI